MDTTKFQKNLQELQARASKLNRFLYKLEKSIFVLPDDFTIRAGSQEHFNYLDIYAKGLKCMESVLEASRRAILLDAELQKEGSGDRESDELYRMLKTLDPEEITTLKEAYYVMRGKDSLGATSNVQ